MTEHVHVSDLRWDRLLAGELADDAKASVIAAADACATCGARLAELTREHGAFATRPMISPPKRRRRVWQWTAPAALAAAAAIVLLVRARANDDATGERVKGGGPHLIVEAGPRDRVAPVSAGDRVHPGDTLQAGYSAERAGFGAVLSRDGSGAANVYVPSRGDTMVALPAGVERSFPESTVLDDVVGEELVILIWCERAVPIAPLARELASRGDITPPAGCTHRRIALAKQVP